MSYFHMGSPTLSSALSGFTSEFGMDSGGSHSLLSPDKLVGKTGMSYLIPVFRIRKVEFLELCTYIQLAKTFECYMVKPHGQLVQVSFTHY